MNILFQINNIKDHIGNGNLGHFFKVIKNKFLETLREELEDDTVFKKFEEDITILSAFYNRVENSKKVAILNTKEYQIDLNIITQNLFSLLNEITENISNNDILFEKFVKGNVDVHQGFHKEDINKTLIKAAKLIEKAKHFRVVGVGRQYINKFRNIESINKYYKAIEDRINDIKMEDRFRYRRITIMELTQEFQTHLAKCFDHADQANNKNKAELILLEDIEMQFTYFIIDEDIVVINLYTYSNENVLDCPHAYWSNEPETINLFINHFDRVWRREHHCGNIISSKKEYNEFIPFNLDLLTNLRDIKSYIKRLPRESARTSWAINELTQTKERLKGLTEYSLGIKNKVTNGKLLVLFSYYVRQLNKGNKYLTISFFEFWENITSEDTNEFYNANRMALGNGADITRVYLIDSSKITTDRYISKQKLIIKMHCNLMKSFANYQF
ncbi:MAG: hypothetical protein AB8G15_01490, partial [Saprospiraceae bacterium]